MQLKKNTRESMYGSTSPGSSAGTDTSNEDAYYGDLPAAPVRSGRNTNDQDNTLGSAVRESVVDSHSTFDGRYETDQDLRIEGIISGEVVCRGTLTIERDASVNAKIEARDAAIRGRVDGEISCSGRLLLTGTAIVTGTLKAGTLVIEEGAALRGTVETLNESSISAPAASSRVSRNSNSESKSSDESTREPAPMSGRGSRSREVPSFALVSSDERASGDRS